MTSHLNLIKDIDFSKHDDCRIICDRVNSIFPISSNSKLEYSKAINFLHDKNLNSFIEIGSAYGGSFLVWASLIKGIKLSIDLPYNLNEGTHPYPVDLTNEYIINVRNKLWEDWYPNETFPIIGNSQLQSTADIIEKILAGRKVDFLYIDAEHTYDAVTKDFNNYVKFVNPGGYVGFHDCQIADERNMKSFWDEISQKYENWTFKSEDSDNFPWSHNMVKEHMGMIKLPY